MSFYRTYRPQVIEEIDNIHVRSQLMTLLSKDTGKLPHAYLLTGPKGSGKTTTARVIAKLFNCEKPDKNGPCGTCESCVAIKDGRTMDVIEIDAASNRGIDDIRTLREGIHLTPVSFPYKIYIIDEVHMLTTEAFNALLKTLEEPPAHAIFILATTDVQKVPATIVSRCITITFSKANKEELLHALSRVVKKEKIPIDEDVLAEIAALSDGAFRDAVKMLEQVSMQISKTNPAVTLEMVRGTLSITDEKTKQVFIKAVMDKDAKKAIELVRTLVADGRDIKQFLTGVLSVLETEVVAGTLGTKNPLWDIHECQVLIRSLTDAYGMMRVSPIVELPLELVVVEYCEKQEAVQQSVQTNDSVTLQNKQTKSEVAQEKKQEDPGDNGGDGTPSLLTLEKLEGHWTDFIEALKLYNHSIAGVLRSTKPKSIAGGVVTIEAFYPFHQERLSTVPVRDMLSSVLKKLFGAAVKVEIVLGKK